MPEEKTEPIQEIEPQQDDIVEKIMEDFSKYYNDAYIGCIFIMKKSDAREILKKHLS